MASEPTVCAIMLTKDRPELAARAVRCFLRDICGSDIESPDPVLSGPASYLYILDTSRKEVDPGLYQVPDGVLFDYEGPTKLPLGALRNLAIERAIGSIKADIIIHYDDDDYSHPNRIAEQVAFLQSSGAAVVGYNQMLFWNKWGHRIEVPDPEDVSKTMWVNSFDNRGLVEAWLYTGPAHQPLGTSLCYWRSTWESHRFDDRKHAGEDSDFLARVGHRRVKSCSSLGPSGGTPFPYDLPRMIATVHGANTQQKTYDGFFKGGTVEMKRVAEWDERVRGVLEGA